MKVKNIILFNTTGESYTRLKDSFLQHTNLKMASFGIRGD